MSDTSLTQALDAVDAFVYSSPVLQDPEAREQLATHCYRWLRALGCDVLAARSYLNQVQRHGTSNEQAVANTALAWLAVRSASISSETV